MIAGILEGAPANSENANSLPRRFANNGWAFDYRREGAAVPYSAVASRTVRAINKQATCVASARNVDRAPAGCGTCRWVPVGEATVPAALAGAV